MKKSVIFVLILLVLIIASVLAFNFSGINGFAVKSISKCSDSDNGNEPFIQGVVKYKLLFLTKIYEDKCLNKNQLKEYYCEKNELKSKIHNCENGCENGACKQEECSQDGERKCIGNGYKVCRVYYGEENCPDATGDGKKTKCFKWSDVIPCSRGCVDGHCLETITFSCSLEKKNGFCGYREEILPSIFEEGSYKVLSQSGLAFEDTYFKFVANFPENLIVDKPFIFRLSIKNKQGIKQDITYNYSTSYPDYYEIIDFSSELKQNTNIKDFFIDSFNPYETKNILIKLKTKYSTVTTVDPYFFIFNYINKDNNKKDLIFTPYVRSSSLTNSIKCGNSYFSYTRPATSPVEFSNIVGGAPKNVYYNKGICCNGIFYPSAECCGNDDCKEFEWSNGYCIDGICMGKTNYKNKLYGIKKVSFVIIGNSETCEQVEFPEYSDLVNITNRFYDVMALKIINKESDFIDFSLDKVIKVPSSFEGDINNLNDDTALNNLVLNSCGIDLNRDDIIIAEENLLQENLRFGSIAEGRLIGGRGNGKLIFLKGYKSSGKDGKGKDDQTYPIFNKCTFIHEIGHVFGCKDLYGDIGGILQWGNTLYGLNKDNQEGRVCYMISNNQFDELRAQSLLVCRGELKWTDLNNNGIIDIME